MVAEASRKTTTTTVTSFAPRQVVLLNRNMKQKGAPEAVENDVEVKARKSEKKRRKELQKMGPLLRSIAAFLDRKGLSATLSALLSEASIEVDNWKTESFNIEDMFYEFSISSKNLGTAITNDSKEQDSMKDETPRENNEEKDHKRKRKGVVGEGRVTETKLSMSEEIHKPDLNNSSCDVEEVDTESKEEKKKKKKKKSSESLGNVVEQTTVDMSDLNNEDHLGVPSEKSKGKKKNNMSMDPEIVEQDPDREMLSNDGKLVSELPMSTSNEAELDGTTLKSKDKKKRKQKTGRNADMKKSDENGVDVKNKKHKKRKRSESEEQDSLSDDHFEIQDKPVNNPDGFDDMKAIKKLAPESQSQLSNGNGNPSKKRKAEKSDDDRENSDDANIDNMPALQGEKEKPTVDCGVVVPTPKTLKKENSAEPRTAKAFQRVKIDEVEFVDERLQDNSYWAKSGADTGYGAKAQEVLGQVRGRDFRHEKTKKKRGSYRGGQIDLQSHSIKFNYSDDE